METAKVRTNKRELFFFLRTDRVQISIWSFEGTVSRTGMTRLHLVGVWYTVQCIGDG